MSYEKIYEKLKDNIKKLLVNLAFLFPFWGLAIFITKPSFLENPIHIQFILTFCLSFMWLLIYFLIAVLIITIFSKKNIFIVLELGNFLSICSLSIFINIAYYYGQSLTHLLQNSFIYSAKIIGILSILNFANHVRKYRK
jgi:hypothetical protein